MVDAGVVAVQSAVRKTVDQVVEDQPINSIALEPNFSQRLWLAACNGISLLSLILLMMIVTLLLIIA